jgi:hypothetical protein
MVTISDLQKLDARILGDFKKTYLESPEKGFAERIQMSTFAVISILLTIAHEQIYMIAIFAAVSLFIIIWSLYSLRTFCILRKEGKNMDEPIFIHGPVSRWRIFIFVPAYMTIILLIFIPGVFKKLLGYGAGSLYRLTDIIYPIALAIVCVEFWRFFMTVKVWCPRRHLIFVLLLAVAGIAFFLFTAPMHRTPTLIDLM